MMAETFVLLRGVITYGAAVITAIAAAGGVFIGLRKSQDEFSPRVRQERELGTALKRLELWEKRLKMEEIVLSGPSLDFARAQTRAAIETIWQQTNHSLALLASWDTPPKPGKVGAWRRTFLLYLPSKSKGYSAGILLRIAFLAALAGAFSLLLVMLRGFIFLLQHRSEQAAVGQLLIFFAPIFFLYFALLATTALIQYGVQREGTPSKLETLLKI